MKVGKVTLQIQKTAIEKEYTQYFLWIRTSFIFFKFASSINFSYKCFLFFICFYFLFVVVLIIKFFSVAVKRNASIDNPYLGLNPLSDTEKRR